MKIETAAADIWREHDKAVAYNNGINLYDNVKQNENFFIGKQWEGLNAPDLDKPVLNFLKRVVAYFISMIVTDNIAAEITPHIKTDDSLTVCDFLSKEVKKVIEVQKIISKNRDILRDMAVDGDGCAYVYFDSKTGRIAFEIVENTRIEFGNPYIQDVQKQPYVTIVQPVLLSSARELAKAENIDEGLIKPDYEEAGTDKTDNAGADRVTVLVKFWRNPKTGTIWFCKTTKNCVLKKPTDTKYAIYPIAYGVWDRIKNSYHGQAALTGLIPNQIAVNKLWAMALRHMHMSAFPTVLFNKQKMDQWTNRVGAAIAVNGDPNEAVAGNFRPAEMSAQLINVVDKTISMTRDFMGASDAALGNVKPDNTSAIIAVQKASSAPLELQKLGFYAFVEDYVRIIIEIITKDYGMRSVAIADENGNERLSQFDFGSVDLEQYDINVEIGAAAYWSELSQIQTLDNLYDKGLITDPEIYIEGIPDGYIKDKSKIVKSIKSALQEQERMQAQTMGGDINAMPIM